jgi:hypothetical protein
LVFRFYGFFLEPLDLLIRRRGLGFGPWPGRPPVH